jgi:outer membrane protein assembly factor BamB
MIPLRRACSAVLACACAWAVAGLAGCSGPQIVRCSPPEHAYALDVTTAGRVRWQVPLGAPATFGFSLGLAPLAVGAVAVFAQGDVLYGLRLADGHRLWSRARSQDIAGMWRWQNLVVVLTQPDWSGLPLPVLTGLDASTGQTRWTRRVGEGMGGFYPTADGGLAMGRGFGVVEVVDMSSGQVRWTRSTQSLPGRPAGPEDAPMAVGGGAVLIAVNSQLTSYDDRTGQVRWADTLMPSQLEAGDQLEVGDVEPGGLQAFAGLVYVTGRQQFADGQSTPVLLGISAADGRVKWRFMLSPPEGSLDAYAPGLISVTSSSGGTWQDRLDPATGRVRWQVASAYHAIATPVGIVAGPDTVTEPDGAGTELISQISMHDTLTGQTRWTAGLTSEWQSPALPVFPAGSLLIVPAAGADGSDLLAALRMSDGHRVWQVTIPAPVDAPLSAGPSGMLVYSATVMLPC